MNRIKAVNLGRNRANRIGTVGVTLFNSGGSVTTVRSTSGISQIGSGIYFKVLTIPNDWNGIILWDDGGTAGRLYAPEVHDAVDESNYIGSVVWSKNPNNFVSADTFGQRISKILERASSGVGGVAVASQIFNEKEKQLLFDWIKLMLDRMKSMERIIGELNPETKKVIAELFVGVKINQAKLEDSLEHFIKLDTRQKEGIKNDINFIASSFEEITNMNSNIKVIRDELAKVEKEIQFSIRELPVQKLSSTIVTHSQDLKALLNQSINIANDVSTRLVKNLVTLSEDRKDFKFMEKLITKLLPTEKLKEIINNE